MTPSDAGGLDLRFADVGIDEVQPHPQNPRRGDVQRISESLSANGLYGFVGVQRSTKRILYGNHTWQAAKRLGHRSIRVCWLDCDDETALRILLADNRTSDVGAYDEVALAETLTDLLRTAQTLQGSGYNDDEYKKLVKRALGEKSASADDGAGPHDADADQGPKQWELVVACKSEEQQRKLLEDLTKRQLPVRALTQ